ncbi:MAG: hypothetical protein LBG48_04165 [Rickettsiales bacterium]|jgi:hypothetical protein|nr:hypothetical protein [Rickettsiales bacterium]
MSFFDKLLQTILNEEQLGNKKELNETLVDVVEKKIEEEKQKLKINKEKTKSQSAIKKVGFDFIFNTDSDVININNNDIIVVEDYVNIDDINVDSFIESHRLNNISADMDGVVDVTSPVIHIERHIDVLERKLSEEDEEGDDDGGAKYRDKTREQEEKLRKLKGQSKKQKRTKNIIINVLIFLRHKRDFWGLVTRERGLNKEKGGCNRDYEMEEKIRAEYKARRKKIISNRKYFISRIKSMRRSVSRILLVKKTLRKLNKLLGKRVAMRLLRVLAKNGKLNAKNINNIVKKLTIIKKRIKMSKKSVAKTTKKIKALERRSNGIEEEQKVKKETKKLEKVKEEAKVKEKENLEKIKDVTKKKNWSRGMGI